jgi:general secretion pathway protein L
MTLVPGRLLQIAEVLYEYFVLRAREVRLQLEAFLRWWGAELWACLPEAWRHRLRHRKRHFLAAFADDRLRVVVVERNNPLFRCDFALASQNAQQTRFLAEVKHAIRQRQARLEVIVPEEHVLRRKIELPLAVADNPREALRSELDQDTRFQLRDVYFDYSVVSTDRDTMTLEVAIVSRGCVDGIKTALRDAQLNPSTISAWRDGTKRPDATFLTVNTERSPATTRSITIALAVVVVALDAAAAYLPLWTKLDALSDLQTRILSIKADVEGVARIQQSLRESRDMNIHFYNLKIETPSTVEILGELARVLPDSAWLEQLQVHGGRVQLAGLTGDAAELVVALEQSPELSDVRLEWPLVPVSAESADRFDISARIDKRSGTRR